MHKTLADFGGPSNITSSAGPPESEMFEATATTIVNNK